MALSYTMYTGDGVQTDFTCNFQYLDQAHVKVYVDGQEVTNFTWLTSSMLRFNTPPANGADIKIKRETPLDSRFVDFTNGSVLKEDNLDLDANQLFYSMQEVNDDATTRLAVDTTDNYDAVNRRIKNLADPVNDQDAVTKNWAETAMSSQVAQAISAKEAAETAQAAAATSESNAATSEANAATSEANAATSASSASASEANAATSATNAATSEANAATSASNLATAESNASQSEKNALDSALEAGSWANEDEDVPVKEYTAGVGSDRSPTVFSAKHWWAKAVALVTSMLTKTSDTGSAELPVGTTAQRDVSPLAGYIRFNTDLQQYEGFDGTAWTPVGAGASGGAGNPVFYENDTNVSADYTITTGKNAMSAGPITVDTGVTVTVPSGSVWTIV